MELIPLGCLAGMPAAGLASSGYLVRAADQAIMLDAGPGTALVLGRHLGVPPSAVVVTHEHTDHLLDLLVLGKIAVNARLVRDESGAVTVDESVPRVPLLVPRGATSRLRQLAALYPVTTYPVLDRAFDVGFDVHEYEPGEEVAIGAVSLRLELLRHVAPNCGVRLEHDGRALAYTGDTGVTDALPSLAEGAGMLLAECSLEATDTSGHGHLCATDAAAAARDAGVAALTLTHFASPDRSEHARHTVSAAAVFDGPVRSAWPGTPLEIPTISPTTSREALS